MTSAVLNPRVEALRPEHGPREPVQRMLDAAERLFTEHGFAGTSLRMITQHASVNLASVNYHFGSKEVLLQEVFVRRLAPLNQQCVEALERLGADMSATPTVHAALAGFLTESLKVARVPELGGVRFVRLLSRAFIEPHPALRQLLPRQYAPLVACFKRVFRELLPDLPDEVLLWRLHFTFGTIFYALAGNDALHLVAPCTMVDADDAERVAAQLLPFLEAGLTAPVPRAIPTGDLS